MAGKPSNNKKGAKAASSPQKNNKRKVAAVESPSKKAKVAPSKAAKSNGKKAAAKADSESEDDESWAYGAVSGSDESDIEEMVSVVNLQVLERKRRMSGSE